MVGKWGVFARVVIFTVICAVGLLFLSNTMANHVSGDSSHYKAVFANVSGLRPGDDVRAAGVKVGRVDEVELAQDHALVSFVITERQPVTTATHLTLRYQSLLGQRYLAMVKGEGVRGEGVKGEDTGATLPSGATIPSSRTDSGFDLTALLNGFEPLFATLKPQQVNQLAESIVAVLQGQGGTIESLLGNTATLTNRLADQHAVIERVLTSLTPVLEDIAGRGERVDRTIADLRSLLTKLADRHDEIGSSIDAVSTLSDATSDLVESTRAPIRRDVRALKTFGRISVQQTQVIRAMLASIPVGTLAFARPFSNGGWLQIYLCNLAVNLDGTNDLNVGSPTGPYSAACRA